MSTFQTTKTISVNNGKRAFVFSAKNQFSFPGPKETGSTVGGQTSSSTSTNQQQSQWKQQLPVNYEPGKTQQQQQQQQQQMQNSPSQELIQQNQQKFPNSMNPMVGNKVRSSI